VIAAISYCYFLFCLFVNIVMSCYYVFYFSGDPDSSSLNPFDLLGTEGSSGGGNPLFSNLLASPYPSAGNNFFFI
jgi:hypothetical protein